MTIREAILGVDSLAEESIVYSLDKHGMWTPESLCFVFDSEEDATVIHRHGHTLYYFLEKETIQEVIEGWISISPTRPTPEELVKAVIYYAEHDCWPDPTEQNR